MWSRVIRKNWWKVKLIPSVVVVPTNCSFCVGKDAISPSISPSSKWRPPDNRRVLAQWWHSRRSNCHPSISTIEKPSPILAWRWRPRACSQFNANFTVPKPLVKSRPRCWISWANIGSESLLMGCLYLPPGPCRSNLLSITDASNYSTIFLGPRFVMGDLSASWACWSTSTATKYLLSFVAITQLGGWMQHLADQTRSSNIPDLIFTIELEHARTFVEISFSGCHHLPVGCTFITAFESSIPCPNSRP